MRLALLTALTMTALPAFADDELIEEGGELYAESCARCHGDDLDGLLNYRGSLEELRLRHEGEPRPGPLETGRIDDHPVRRRA